MMRLITGGNFGGDHLPGSEGALAAMRRSRSHLGSKTSPAMWWQLGARKARACLNDAAQIGKERVSSIRAIETVISIRPACDEANRVHSGQLFLDRAQSESGQNRQLANVALPFLAGEEQA